MKFDKINFNEILKKGFFWIPLVIIGCMFIGYFINISQYGWSSLSFSGSSLLSLSNTIWILETMPLVVVVYSIMLLVSQGKEIKRYKNQFHKSSYFGLIERLEFLLKLPKRYFIPRLAYSMLLLWGIGWGLYILAIWSAYGKNGNVAEIMGYSAMASLDLFLLDINGNILDNIGSSVENINQSIIKGGIVLTAIFAAFCSFSLVIRIFLSSLFSTLHTSALKVSESTSHFYVFFGINEKAKTLSNSIKESDDKALLIFIDSPSDNYENTDGIQNIIDLISPASSSKTSIELDKRTLHLISCNHIRDCSPDKDIWMSLGLESFDKLISKLCKQENPEIHFFFLSEDRNQNITDSKIIRDALKAIGQDKEEFKNIKKSIYLQSRREAVTAIIEDKNIDVENNIYIKLIDDSNLAVDQLKSEEKFHPVNFVDIDTEDNPGSVKSPFTSLIIGFGETGRDSFRFLYEFGSFVNHKATQVHGKTEERFLRSPFECHIVDNHIDEIKDTFIANSPSIFNRDANKQISDKNIIKFHNCTDNSEEFYALLDSIADKLNYVIVCAGDDEQNITIAVRVLKYVLRERGSDPKLTILVRAYDKGAFSHLESVKNYYNDLLEHPYIEIFGSTNQIYNYNHIVIDKALQKAEDYHETYSSVANKVDKASQESEESDKLNSKEAESVWSMLVKSLDYNSYRQAFENKNKDENKLREQKGEPPRTPLSKYEALLDTRRQIKENCKNALHAPTNINIIQRAISGYNETNDNGQQLTIESLHSIITNLHENWGERFDVLASKTKLNGVEEKTSNFIKQLLENLCKTEHIRWNSSHELQGFRFGKTKNFKHMTHQCLADWDDLASGDKRYDYLVIETDLTLYVDSKKQCNSDNENKI